MSTRKWSVYFQNPEYIEYTRMDMVMPEYEPLIRGWCGIRDGVRVLEVGCGTGYFSRLLARGGHKASFTGIDLDDIFIEYAREKAAEEGLEIHFELADACSLPYEDDSFDVVTSHTFLTTMPEPEKAFSEMKRVAKPGGIIASVTSMSAMPAAVSLGYYPSECDAWRNELQDLLIKLLRAYRMIDPMSNYVTGVRMHEIPHFFAEQGMERISVYPVGKTDSLSNAALSDEHKLRRIDLYEQAEIKKLEAFMALPEMAGYFSREEADRYKELLAVKCDFLRSDLRENRIWEWNGGANILVTGTVPSRWQ